MYLLRYSREEILFLGGSGHLVMTVPVIRARLSHVSARLYRFKLLVIRFHDSLFIPAILLPRRLRWRLGTNKRRRSVIFNSIILHGLHGTSQHSSSHFPTQPLWAMGTTFACLRSLEQLGQKTFFRSPKFILFTRMASLSHGLFTRMASLSHGLFTRMASQSQWVIFRMVYGSLHTAVSLFNVRQGSKHTVIHNLSHLVQSWMHYPLS